MDEINEAVKKFQKELNSGTSALILLSVMNQAETTMYGYQIAKIIEAKTKNVEIMKQGALYPVLRSLEATGLLDSHVEPSVSGPPRRYYSITESGRTALSRWTDIWQDTREFVDAILQGGDDD